MTPKVVQNSYTRHLTPGQWPKTLPTLTEEQQRIREEFYQIWLEELPHRYGILDRFNHGYATRSANEHTARTLDIGAGTGEHLHYENLKGGDYTALDLRPEMGAKIRAAHPTVNVVIGDIQSRLDFPDHYFDRILAIHVLEHLPDLPKALDEIQRLLHPNGTFAVLIPCDPGLAYSLGRNLSARRLFERRYKISYDWFIACEHINRPDEIITELHSRFRIAHSRYFPLWLPLVDLNLVIGLILRHPNLTNAAN
ncbi:MAG: class I SAM-dependent methyltransferase [Aggregatilineales bacterium]